MSTIVTRFAPSPTGHLHIGGARTALFCWLLARHFGGQFLLRIEDTDTERSRKEYTDSILASMRWLGLTWDGELTYQSQRADVYTGYVDKLLQSGHAYWCECSPETVEAMREEARQKGLKPRYNGCCREKKLGPGAGRVVRLKAPLEGSVVFEDMVKGFIATSVEELDDMVLRRSDGMPTYNMAVVVDDHEMGITHVMRGDDHVPNTPKQILIYQALGLKLPIFGHVPMILGPDRQKLSKRHGARAVIEYEEDGLLPQALINCLVRLGWSRGDQELFTLEELVRHFDGNNLNGSPSAFDPDKLEWLNAHYLRETPPHELVRLVKNFVLAASQELPAEEQLEKLVLLFRERATNLKILAALIHTMLCPAQELSFDPKAVEKNLKPEGKAHLAALEPLFAATRPFTKEALDATLQSYIADNGLSFKQVGPALRLALSASQGGPHLPDMMEVLGPEAVSERLLHAQTL